jgi:hypothetical protein
MLQVQTQRLTNKQHNRRSASTSIQFVVVVLREQLGGAQHTAGADEHAAAAAEKQATRTSGGQPEPPSNLLSVDNVNLLNSPELRTLTRMGAIALKAGPAGASQAPLA